MSLDDEVKKDSYIEDTVNRKVLVATTLNPISKRWYYHEKLVGSIMIASGIALESLATYNTVQHKFDYRNHLLGLAVAGVGVYFLRLAKKSYEQRANFCKEFRKD